MMELGTREHIQRTRPEEKLFWSLVTSSSHDVMRLSAGASFIEGTESCNQDFDTTLEMQTGKRTKRQ